MQFGMALVGNLIMGTSKVVDRMENKATSRKTKVVTMVVERVIELLLMAIRIADHVAKMVAKMIMSVETGIIPIRNAKLLRIGLYYHPHRL